MNKNVNILYIFGAGCIIVAANEIMVG